LRDIAGTLPGQLGQFQSGGLFDDAHRIVAFLPAITGIHAAGAKAAWAVARHADQNDEARSFVSRFIAQTSQMPDAAHAAAYVAVRHYLRAVAASEGMDAGLNNKEMRRAPVYFAGQMGRPRLDGRLAADRSLTRAKPPEAMHGEWDYYEAIGVVPAADIYRRLSQFGCPLGM
jgi:branched-chain amino acid transport system substrate-binding protein